MMRDVSLQKRTTKQNTRLREKGGGIEPYEGIIPTEKKKKGGERVSNSLHSLLINKRKKGKSKIVKRGEGMAKISDMPCLIT